MFAVVTAKMESQSDSITLAHPIKCKFDEAERLPLSYQGYLAQWLYNYVRLRYLNFLSYN